MKFLNLLLILYYIRFLKKEAIKTAFFNQNFLNFSILTKNSLLNFLKNKKYKKHKIINFANA